jgi:hypothetical protein
VNRLSHSIVMSVVLAFSGWMFVSEASAASLACGLAFKRTCGHVTPTGAQLHACFDANLARLERICGDTLTHAFTVTRVCEADKRRLCGNVTRASGLHRCMTRRMSELSAPCRTALARAGLRSAR